MNGREASAATHLMPLTPESRARWDAFVTQHPSGTFSPPKGLKTTSPGPRYPAGAITSATPMPPATNPTIVCISPDSWTIAGLNPAWRHRVIMVSRIAGLSARG